MDGPASATILVAEDEPTLLRLITRLLERAGFRVIGVRDGTEALQAVEAQRDAIDVALLDVSLPPEGGAAILRSILASGRAVGAVLTSGMHLSPADRHLLESCDGRFLSKPFPPAALLETISAVRPVREGSG